MIFVEGQAERLLVPEFISNNFEALSSRYISILEVSGAHTHKYRELVEVLGIVSLVITDLDSVGDDGKKCAPMRSAGQVTNNDTLKSWHPKKNTVDELVDVSLHDRSNGKLFVAYQKPVTINSTEVLSRTFEDALILANYDDNFFKSISSLQAKISDAETVSDGLFDYVKTLTKGDFAFECLFHLADDEANTFQPPEYISEGLKWLETELSPNS